MRVIAYRSWRTRRMLVALVAGSIVAASLVPAVRAESGSAAAGAAPPTPHPREKTYMKRQWGVDVLFLRQTSAGYMLEFRYKVLDPDKARPLFDRQTKPVLTHVSTGAKLIVPTPPKTGALRNSNPPLADHTYWMFFANPGQLVQPGDIVDVEIGDFAVRGLVVQ